VKALLILLAVNVVVRLLLWLVYEPVPFNDTLGYLELAQQMQALDLSQNSAARSPGYPFLLWLAGIDYRVVWAFQSVLGLMVSLMLFGLAYYHTGDEWVALLVGLTHTLAINQLFFEAAILTEALSVFLLVASFFLFVMTGRDQELGGFPLVILGVVVGLAVLTRPLLLVLIPLNVAFLGVRWWRQRMGGGRWVLSILAFAVPALVLVLGWSGVNYRTAGYFGVSAILGYNLVEHAGPFMELAPEEDAELRDIYLGYRDKGVAETGSTLFTIWDAVGDMRAATGLSFTGLSGALTDLSVGLFVRYPGLYLRSVATAWTEFWGSAISWDPNKVGAPLLSTPLRWLWRIERAALIAVNLAFLVIAAHSVLTLKRKPHPYDYDPEAHWFVITLVLLSSMAQAMLNLADNGRYSVPYQPLITYTVILWGWFYWRSVRQRSRRAVVVPSGLGPAPQGEGRS
jgi:4-amino-4-deoxy-L-arabinose transferase-like glycosyltransferase